MAFKYGFNVCIFCNQILSGMNANELLIYMTIMNIINRFKINLRYILFSELPDIYRDVEYIR